MVGQFILGLFLHHPGASSQDKTRTIFLELSGATSIQRSSEGEVYCLETVLHRLNLQQVSSRQDPRISFSIKVMLSWTESSTPVGNVWEWRDDGFDNIGHGAANVRIKTNLQADEVGRARTYQPMVSRRLHNSGRLFSCILISIQICCAAFIPAAFVNTEHKRNRWQSSGPRPATLLNLSISALSSTLKDSRDIRFKPGLPQLGVATMKDVPFSALLKPTFVLPRKISIAFRPDT